MREKGQTEMAKTLETPVFSRGIEILTEKTKLALKLVDWSQEDPEPWGDLSVNLGIPVEKDCAFIDTNNLGEEILPWIEKTGLGSPTGRTERSGFVVYPEYHFNPGRLKELDDFGYELYENLFWR